MSTPPRTQMLEDQFWGHDKDRAIVSKGIKVTVKTKPPAKG